MKTSMIAATLNSGDLAQMLLQQAVPDAAVHRNWCLDRQSCAMVIAQKPSGVSRRDRPDYSAMLASRQEKSRLLRATMAKMLLDGETSQIRLLAGMYSPTTGWRVLQEFSEKGWIEKFWPTKPGGNLGQRVRVLNSAALRELLA